MEAPNPGLGSLLASTGKLRVQDGTDRRYCMRPIRIVSSRGTPLCLPEPIHDRDSSRAVYVLCAVPDGP